MTWDGVVQVHKAKARLREIHATMLRQHVEQMMAGENVSKAMGWDGDADEVTPTVTRRATLFRPPLLHDQCCKHTSRES